jgi:deoxycytidylate deaminase
MKIDLKLIDDLKTLALSGTHPKVWIASALVYRNKIISYGVNQMKSHPYQSRYSRNEEAIYWHSETSAIFNADKKIHFDKFEKSTLYVARVKYESTKKDSFISGICMPCDGCIRCIKDYGIKTVIYTIDPIEGSKEHFGILRL